MKHLLLTASVLFALIAFNSCSDPQSSNSLEKIRSVKKIRVGYIPYFDITFRDARTGETSGFLVDVLFEALRGLEIRRENVEFVETDWANFGIGLARGKYDLSIAGTFNTPVRAKIVDFSRPIFYLGNGAVVKKEDDRFHTIQDFNREGLTIAAVQGEQGYEYAKKNLPKATIIAQSGPDLTLAPLQVTLGKADAALSDQYILRKYCDKNSDVKDALANNPYDVLPICWSVRKGSGDSDLLNYVNDQLSKMEQSGSLQNIMSKYPMIPFARVPE
jgi:ABC-type amino acid transport substrate-binding protein